MTRRFPWGRYLKALLLIVLTASLPLLSALSAGLVAQALGCTLNEGNVHPCILLGVDLGMTLYTLFVLGWFMLLTLPYGVIALAIWLVVLLVHLVRHGRRHS